MKVMLSQPMNGKSEEEIKAIREKLFGCSEYMPKPDKVDDEGRTLNGCE